MAAMASLHGFEIDCDRALRRASPAAGSLGTVTVRASSESPLDRAGRLLHLIAGPDCIPSHALARADGALVSWHADSGSFLIDGPEGRISYRPEDAWVEAGETAWEHRLGSSAVPLLAGEVGGLPLHASAVAIDGRAVLICGVTGRGKSTLAAMLAARGREAIADDGVVVELQGGRPAVWPGLGGAMLTIPAADAIGITTPEADGGDARGRVHIDPVATALGPSPVGAVVILMERSGERVRTIRPDPAKAHRELLAHVISAERRGPATFASSAKLVERVPVALLVVPDSVGELERAAEALESLPTLA
jgi:hypothetical protein